MGIEKIKILNNKILLNDLISFDKLDTDKSIMISKIPIRLWKESDSYYYFGISMSGIGGKVGVNRVQYVTFGENFRYNINNDMHLDFYYRAAEGSYLNIRDGRRGLSLDYLLCGDFKDFEINHKHLGVLKSKNLIMNKYHRLLKIKKCDILKELREELMKLEMVRELYK